MIRRVAERARRVLLVTRGQSRTGGSSGVVATFPLPMKYIRPGVQLIINLDALFTNSFPSPPSVQINVRILGATGVVTAPTVPGVSASRSPMRIRARMHVASVGPSTPCTLVMSGEWGAGADTSLINGQGTNTLDTSTLSLELEVVWTPDNVPGNSITIESLIVEAVYPPV